MDFGVRESTLNCQQQYIMALPVSSLNGVKIYNLSSGKSLPQWLKDVKNKRTLRYNTEFRSRIELIQDLEFPVASSSVSLSKNGKFLVSTGTYPPQVKVFELDELSMKFERHLDADVVRAEVLSDDFSKLVFLREDRFIEFHARYGHHYKTRVPKFGRDLVYQYSTCDLYVAGADPELWRLNLEQGRFLKGIDTGIPELNIVEMNPIHELILVAGTSDQMEFYDPRDRTKAASIRLTESVSSIDSAVASRFSEEDLEITAGKFDVDGLTFALGTNNGLVAMYDLRSSVPLSVKDHRYDLPIKSIHFHPKGQKIISSDAKIIKLWERNVGNFDLWTTIQPPVKIGHVTPVPDSGLLFASSESSRVQSFYVPQLGPAPQWCNFLDSITEELEEERGTTVFDDYKFVTREELEKLGLEHLIGTKLLRAYMHGFFMDIRLYKKVKAVADPFEYAEYIKGKVQKKIQDEKEQRIVIKRQAPKINKAFAEHLQSKNRSQGQVKEASDLIDNRFSAMFKDADFQIDEQSEEFLFLHPNKKPNFSREVDEDDRFDLIQS